MSSPLTAEVLRGACECVASLSLGTGGLTAVDAAVETHLEALDEASSTLEASRAHIADAVDAGFPSLRANTAELRALFAAVEAAEASVARVAAAARAASERLEALERGYAQKWPSTSAKLGSWFGVRPRTALDAPIVLPPWDAEATRLDVGAEVAALGAPLGDALELMQSGARGEEGAEAGEEGELQAGDAVQEHASDPAGSAGAQGSADGVEDQ